jgi:hypothetical protein
MKLPYAGKVAPSLSEKLPDGQTMHYYLREDGWYSWMEMRGVFFLNKTPFKTLSESRNRSHECFGVTSQLQATTSHQMSFFGPGKQVTTWEAISLYERRVVD